MKTVVDSWTHWTHVATSITKKMDLCSLLPFTICPPAARPPGCPAWWTAWYHEKHCLSCWHAPFGKRFRQQSVVRFRRGDTRPSIAKLAARSSCRRGDTASSYNITASGVWRAWLASGGEFATGKQLWWDRMMRQYTRKPWYVSKYLTPGHLSQYLTPKVCVTEIIKPSWSLQRSRFGRGTAAFFERLAEYRWKPHRYLLVKKKTYHRHHVADTCGENRGVLFHRIRDFKQN